jgi:hypothetical protein
MDSDGGGGQGNINTCNGNTRKQHATTPHAKHGSATRVLRFRDRQMKKPSPRANRHAGQVHLPNASWAGLYLL